ncbi:PEGA domain-containing protein [Corallococcus carmarthensis]|uniref:PEGA domain-containing protein n=1 Tax=Corallococcus carmarthensis TaxID=2316728 RepID=A0A3A8KBR1_9BACT|nr:PEGA domain-containing protein [Corallococcus carmarthensis]NOK22918.1 PEGA domain-containing protein [Corallococcus carmarthensis]RKG99841.1 PEGA domain-containing protein [Corallococcus carmarthensis]
MNTTRLALTVALACVLSAPAADAAKRKSAAKKKRPAATKKVPAPVPEDTFTPPDEVAPASDAPVAPKAATQAPLAPVTPAATKRADVQAPAVRAAPSDAVAIFGVARQSAAADSAAKLEDTLTRKLGSAGDIQFVDLATAFPPQEPQGNPRGDALFDEGRSAYDNLDPDTAAVKFKAAAEAYVQRPGDLRPEKLGETYLFQGASQLLNGDVAGAKASFTQALVAEPSLRPDAGMFGQDVQRVFSEAQSELSALPQGTLVVNSQPQGARVLVRGRDVGATPLSGAKLAPGHYPVQVVLPGYAPFATYAEVKPSAPTELKTKLASAPGLSALRDAAAKAGTEAAFDADGVPPEVGAIGERLNARYVVLAASFQDKKGRLHGEVQAWDLRTKNRLRGVEVDFTRRDGKGSADAAADQLHTFLAGSALPQNRKEEKESVSSGDSVLRKPWFWAAAAGVAAVTAGVVYVATTDRGSGFNPVNGLPGGISF